MTMYESNVKQCRRRHPKFWLYSICTQVYGTMGPNPERFEKIEGRRSTYFLTGEGGVGIE